MLTQAQFNKAKHFIYRYGRLLDRKRFAYYFEGGSRDAIIEVLACYQNPDGGFGNGIELDIMCPMSTGIGTETAMFLLDELNATTGEMVERVEAWIVASQHPNGAIAHPPSGLTAYPHGDWWANSDPNRVLSLAGLLGKWGRGNETFFNRTHAYFKTTTIGEIAIYNYFNYLYLRYAPGVKNREELLSQIQRQIPVLLTESATYHPLFVPYWSLAIDEVDGETLESETKKLVGDFEADGGLKSPYPALSWWRPVWTLSALIGLKTHGLLTIGQ